MAIRRNGEKRIMSYSKENPWKSVIQRAIKAASEDGAITIDEFILLEAINNTIQDFEQFGIEREYSPEVIERQKKEIVENLVLLVSGDQNITEKEEKIIYAVIEEIFNILQSRNS